MNSTVITRLSSSNKSIAFSGRGLFRSKIRTMSTQEETKRLWRICDAVCFDVDSTVCIDEAIDEFASFLGCGKQVSELTANAMKGGVTYRTALDQRLRLMNPTRNELHDFIQQHPPRLTPGVKDLVSLLQSRLIAVYLISGGFQEILIPLANILHIPSQNVYANKLQFDSNGCYAGFDFRQPTSESGGKPKVLDMLRKKHGYKTIVMIGDGATDLETFPCYADAFIGFGGNQVREKVQRESKWFVTNFTELISELQIGNS